MESNWRYNVWGYGLSGTGAIKSARGPTSFNPDAIWSQVPRTDQGWDLYISTGMSGYAEGFTFFQQVFNQSWPGPAPINEPDH